MKLTVPPAPIRNADGSVTISNSCGAAEAEYRLQDGSIVQLQMTLGEWCRQPFDEWPRDRQLIFLEANSTLEAFYGIKQFQDGPEYVVIHNTRLRDTLRDETPEDGVFLFTLEGDTDLREFEDGIDETENYVVIGHEVYSQYALYLSDIPIVGAP